MTVRAGPPSETNRCIKLNLLGALSIQCGEDTWKKADDLAVLATVLGTLAVVGFDIGSHVSSLGGARGSALTPGVHRVNLREESLHRHGIRRRRRRKLRSTACSL